MSCTRHRSVLRYGLRVRAGRGTVAFARLACAVVCIISVLAGTVSAQEPSAQLDGFLRAGEFGPALDFARSAPTAEQRQAFLGRVATAQARMGARDASLATLADMDSDLARQAALDRIDRRWLGGDGARGGAALADFDSLIELIKSTIAPDSWDDVGGPGAIEPFPTGVYVDTSGMLRRIETMPGDSLEGVRRDAREWTDNTFARSPSALRKISLTRLEKHVQLLAAQGLEPDDAMRNLAGLTRIRYLLVYPDTGDVVIAGPAGPWELAADGRVRNVETGVPVLQLDDLVVALRSQFGEETVFGCAITPRRENLETVQQFLADSSENPIRPGQRDAWLREFRELVGTQDISVFGLDPRTRAARVLVEADYHMKLIGMGLEEGTLEVQSYLDSIPDDGEPPAMSVLRWWFTMNYDALRATPDHRAFALEGAGVKLLSENEWLTETGRRVHTGTSDELNRQFADSFTRDFERLADKYPVYADLRNIFDLALVAAIIRDQDLAGEADWHLTYFLPEDGYQVALGEAPREVESIVNHRVINRRRFVAGVSGGVSADPGQWIGDVETDDYGVLESDHAQSTPGTLPRDAWWWD